MVSWWNLKKTKINPLIHIILTFCTLSWSAIFKKKSTIKMNRTDECDFARFKLMVDFLLSSSQKDQQWSAVNEAVHLGNHCHPFCITLTSQWPRWRLTSPASRLFTQSFIQAQIKENIKAPRHWPLCEEFTGTGEFPAQRASYAENVSIWWRHHGITNLSNMLVRFNPVILYCIMEHLDICIQRTNLQLSITFR